MKITEQQLLYEIVGTGTYKEMIVLERLLIYSYPVWSGHTELTRPPGCKIFR
jgi:hypothetical protein